MKQKNPRLKMSSEEFAFKANKVHYDKYDYSHCKYEDYFKKVEICCKECSSRFFQTPSNHLAGTGCKKCSFNKQRMNTSEFIEKSMKIHGDDYDYSETNYINARTKVEIKCKKCNKFFTQLPRSHMFEKSGCPICRQSHGEKKISILLDYLGVEYEREKKFDDCLGANKTPFRFDFYIPKIKTCIEYDGKQHSYKNSKYWSKSIKINDQKKNEYCNKNNIKIKRINYTDFNSIECIIKSFLF